MSWSPAWQWIWITRASGAPDTYATFADLYRYCYLVASVVGLVCIRIFGYRDARAEKLAEETGIAFQLTNILRDVAEDAARNRVYLPLEDLAAHGVSRSTRCCIAHPPRRPLLQNALCSLPWAATRRTILPLRRELLPLIDRESRPALWVLVSIYHALLKRIRARGLRRVYAPRQRAVTAQKLAILCVGMARMAWARVFRLITALRWSCGATLKCDLACDKLMRECFRCNSRTLRRFARRVACLPLASRHQALPDWTLTEQLLGREPASIPRCRLRMSTTDPTQHWAQEPALPRAGFARRLPLGLREARQRRRICWPSAKRASGRRKACCPAILRLRFPTTTPS